MRYQQQGVALALHLRKCFAGGYLLNLCFYSQHAGLRPLDRCFLACNFVVQIYRVHLTQNAPCLDAVAHLHIDSLDSTRHSGSNLVGKPSLNCSNSKQRRLQRFACNLFYRHFDRCQRPRPQRDITQQHDQEQHHTGQGHGFSIAS